MDSIVYEDRPRYDIWLKAILAFPLAIVLIPGLYAFSDGDMETALGMFVTAAVVSVAFWAILPEGIWYLIVRSK